MNHRPLVGTVVVQHQMDIEPLRDHFGDDIQKLPKLNSAVAPVALADYFTSGHVQSRKQRRDAVAPVTVRTSFR